MADIRNKRDIMHIMNPKITITFTFPLMQTVVYIDIDHEVINFRNTIG